MRRAMGAVNGLKLVPYEAPRRRRLHYGCRPRPVAAAESRTRSARGQGHRERQKNVEMGRLPWGWAAVCRLWMGLGPWD